MPETEEDRVATLYREAVVENIALRRQLGETTSRLAKASAALEVCIAEILAMRKEKNHDVPAVPKEAPKR